MYNIQPGGVDLPGFPLFGLFNAAMGVTTVIPQMNPSRPARLNPATFIDAINTWQATQSFGSPAIWNRVGRYAQSHDFTLPSIHNVYSAGAPVPPHVLSRLAGILPAVARIHTPYGATEALPVATITAAEVLGETAAKSAQGAGTCVGHKFPGIEWRIIAISDGAITTIDQATELPHGQIGELIVRGDVVSREYVTRREANAISKIADDNTVWHRMGDVGYFDDQHRFWFCGRMAHRVQTAAGTMFSVPCEEIFNQHPSIYRSALVGVGQGIEKRPVIVVEPWPEHRPCCRSNREQLLNELREMAEQHELTHSITDFLIVRSMPVDVRHNAKIRREDLATWATRRI
jgi:acyl-CoA synthetase (AMP-forming)/AMP-acid ligase II